MKYEHVLGFALEHPWAVTDSMRQIIAGILADRIAGEAADPTELAALVNRKNLPQPSRGGVALIPIYGVIAPRMNMLSEMSGGTTFEQLTAQLHDAVANDAVKTILFDVDSPGGNVAGAREFANEVRAARAVKPIVAVAHHLMASAAYWAMAGATTIVATESAMIGAVGVYHIHEDISAALEQKGIKREVIAAGKFKAEGVDGGPLSPEAREHRKALITHAYSKFVFDIAKGRGVTEAAVRNGFGEGRIVSADDALASGMVDRIGTFAETLARYLPAGQTAAALALDTPPAGDQEPITATSIERAAAYQRQQLALALL
jgi:signal peptide peptidase SppA